MSSGIKYSRAHSNGHRESVVSARRCDFSADGDVEGEEEEQQQKLATFTTIRKVLIAAGTVDTFRRLIEWYMANARRPGDQISLFHTVAQPFLNLRTRPSVPVVPGSVTNMGGIACSSMIHVSSGWIDGVANNSQQAAPSSAKDDVCRLLAACEKVLAQAMGCPPAPLTSHVVGTRKRPMRKLADFLASHNGDDIDLVIVENRGSGSASRRQRSLRRRFLGCFGGVAGVPGGSRGAASGVGSLIVGCQIPIVLLSPVVPID